MLLKRLSKDDIVAMRREYAEGVPVEQILAKFKVAKKTFYRWSTADPKVGQGICRRCRGAAAGRVDARPC